MSPRRPKRPKMPEQFNLAERAIWQVSNTETVLRFLQDAIDAEVNRAVESFEDHELEELRTWARSLTSTNCGYAEYEIGQRVLAIIRERET